MRPTPWLRAASILTLFHSIAHTLGGVFGAPPPGPGEAAVAAMKANTFLVMGNQRSFWMFYRGMGLGVTISLTMEAILFWLLGNIARDSDADLRSVFAVFLVGYLVLAMNSFLYFFAPPVVVEILIAACLAMAIVTAKRPAAHAVK